MRKTGSNSTHGEDAPAQNHSTGKGQGKSESPQHKTEPDV